MEMVLHNHIGENGEALVLLQKADRIEEDLGNGWRAEKWQPVDDSGGEEIRCIVVDDFVAAARHIVRGRRWSVWTGIPRWSVERG